MIQQKLLGLSGIMKHHSIYHHKNAGIPTLQEAVHATDEGGQHVVRGAQVPDQVHPGTEQGHQQVSHCQVHQVPVGGAPQVAVEVHHQNDEQVANHGHHEHKHVRHDLGAENSIV